MAAPTQEQIIAGLRAIDYEDVDAIAHHAREACRAWIRGDEKRTDRELTRLERAMKRYAR